MVIWKGQFASYEGLSCADKHCRGFVIKYVKVSSHSKNQPRTWNTLLHTMVNILNMSSFVLLCLIGIERRQQTFKNLYMLFGLGYDYDCTATDMLTDLLLGIVILGDSHFWSGL